MSSRFGTQILSLGSRPSALSSGLYFLSPICCGPWGKQKWEVGG
jgi:hypothetical protein